MKSVSLLLCLVFLTGCSVTQTIAGKAANFAVSSYCKIPSGTLGRKGIRKSFNEAASPNTVLIECSSDKESESGN